MKIDIPHIAKLANLKIDKKDTKTFEKQLTEILSYVEKLKEVPTDNVAETSQVTGLENVLKNDSPSPSMAQEDVLKNAKSAHNGFFKVKAVLED